MKTPTQTPAAGAHTPDLSAAVCDLEQAINYLARQKSRTATNMALAGARALSEIRRAANSHAALVEIATELAGWRDLLRQNYPDLRGLCAAADRATALAQAKGSK